MLQTMLSYKNVANFDKIKRIRNFTELFMFYIILSHSNVARPRQIQIVESMKRDCNVLGQLLCINVYKRYRIV